VLEVSASSPLAPASLRPRGVRLGERQGLGKIDLRGDPHDRPFMTAVGRVLDLLLPSEPCTSAHKGHSDALWLGPDQWLLTCPAGETASLQSALREALAGVHGAVTDVSDAHVALRVAGPSARDVLAKAAVLIHLVDNDRDRGPGFDLYVARSFAHYLWMWLEDAGREYGVSIEPVT
jgi:sarcosine oxidase subunit gamma